MADISFPNIPSNIRIPLFYADLDASKANTGTSTQRALIIGQITASGTGVANTPALSQGASEAKSVGGSGSMLALMTAAYRASDDFGEVWYLPLADDPTAVAATGSVAFTSPATATGVLYLYIGGVRVTITVTSSLTVANLATNLAAAINAVSTLPVTAAVDATTAGKVDLTAKNKGLAAGDIDLRLNFLGVADGESLPTGLAVTITSMSGGAVNPDMTTGLANLLDKEFDFIALPYTDTTSLNLVKSFLSSSTGRWSWSKQIFGHAFTAYRGTLAACTTFGATRNDEHVSIMGFYDSPSPAFVWAADIAGTVAVSVRADPARPVQTLALSTVLAPPIASRFALEDRNVLLWDGISTFDVAADGTVSLENVITTYQTNSYGDADDSYLEVETMTNLTYILRQLKSVITSQFPRMKLADDGTRVTPGTNVVTPSIIKGALVAQYKEMEDDGYVQDSATFAANIIVQKNTSNPNRVDVIYPAILIDQLRIFALLMQFTLQ